MKTPSRKIIWLSLVILALAVGGVLALVIVSVPKVAPVALNMPLELADALQNQRKSLLKMQDVMTGEYCGRSIPFDREFLKKFELLLKAPGDQQGYLFIGSDGKITSTLAAPGRMDKNGELLIADHNLTLFIDGKPLPLLPLRKWDIHWVAKTGESPKLPGQKCPAFSFYDGFMRTELADQSWTVVSGKWQLQKHGGGMPANEEEEHNYEVRRAVNPFSVVGSDNGILSMSREESPHSHFETSFYFGTPKTGNVVDANTLPVTRDMLLILGKLDDRPIAFGWRGEAMAFALMERGAGGEWNILKSWPARRPPLTNWFKLGLDLTEGHVVSAYLDGVLLDTVDLNRRVPGFFHIGSGKDDMEFDDVRAWSLPEPAAKGTPMYVKSRFFATKKSKGGSDPVQFDQWARSINTFTKSATENPDGTVTNKIVTRLPIFGDFAYESVPHDQAVGDLPDGQYEFAIMTNNTRDLFGTGDLVPAFVIKMEHNKDGWQALDLPGDIWPADWREFTLSFARRAENGNRLTLKIKDNFVPVSPPLAGPIHVAVSRITSKNDKPVTPAATTPPPATPPVPIPLLAPEHHAIYCQNLFQEFFEESPVNWNWIEGSFRMAARWACQFQWNFMACGATGVPFMSSKRIYTGTQEHDFYMSLRPVYPWDCGDPDFSYDGDEDGKNGWKIFIEHEGWYNRHDLNFSFCSDGRNPLSGYSLVFAGYDNTETRLLRKGVTVASSKDFFIPRDKDHGVIHWLWWNFRIQKIDGLIRILHNDKTLFEYTDPEPLDGGHIGFWTVRGGFAISRIISTSEKTSVEPQFLYVENSESSLWKPLLTDDVRLTRNAKSGMTDVTANTGAGFHAVRYDLPEPVDLGKTPVMELPFQVKPDTAVNLFLYISGKSYIIQTGAPISGMKSLLTPEFEKGEQFRLTVFDIDKVKETMLLGGVEPSLTMRINLAEKLDALNVPLENRLLQSITVGNVSNTDYLMAGNGANAAGSGYSLGIPVFSEK